MPKLNDILNECVCQNIKYKRPTAVNRVNYVGGGMLWLVNEEPRARWSQLGHLGCRKRARVTSETVMNQLTICDNLRHIHSDFSLIIQKSYDLIASY